MRQHKIRLASAHSNIQADNRLSKATMEIQLKNALKKVEQYSKINQALLRKLDASSVDEEFGKYKTAIQEQEKVIAGLEEDKRALEKLTRGQARQLQVADKVTGPGGVIVSSDGQIQVLNERLRRINGQLSEMRNKDNAQKQEIETLKKTNTKLQKRVGSLKFKSKKANGGDAEDTNVLSLFENPESVDQSTKDMNSSSSPKDAPTSVKSSVVKSKKAAITKAEDLSMVQQQKITLLEKQLLYHKNEHDRYKIKVENELEKQRKHIATLEKEIEAKDRLSRVQIVEVKRLQQTCRDLAEGNKKLQVASDFYSHLQDGQTGNDEVYTSDGNIPQPPLHSRTQMPKKPGVVVNGRSNRIGGSLMVGAS